MDASFSRHRTTIGALSLIVGPALMSLGDLFHPPEDWSAAVQVTIVRANPGRWYASHLLLLIGILLFVPGILALADVATRRRPLAAYVGRVLLLVSIGAFSAVFAFEMLIGRFISEGADQATAVTLLQTFQSGSVFMALAPGLLAFFVGTALLVRELASMAGPFRWPAIVFGLGAVLILGEIILARVVLSQIGNVLNFVAASAFARLLLRVPSETRV